MQRFASLSVKAEMKGTATHAGRNDRKGRHVPVLNGSFFLEAVL